jgi:fructosamine-3-kinase
MRARLAEAIAQRVGSAIAKAWSLAGGDIHEAHAAELADGRRVFVKSNPEATAGMFAAEARGLDWLRAAGAVRLPEVVAVADGAGGDRQEPRFLVLEYIEPAPKIADFDELLGRGLAAVHHFGAPSFGLDHDNFIGVLEQPNGPAADWATFYRARRLEPQLRRATDQGLASTGLRRDFDVLFSRMDGLVGPTEPPSRLHGDLWGGNLHVDERGLPCLIDPAAYGGHREVDLAMMRLFGGFGRRVFDAYEEAWPLAPGAGTRIPLYQLYPLLVHLNHFGPGYASAVARALAQSLAAR